jgi:hypothetical protein
MSDDRLVDKVAKLLAQAEGTDNEHEAAAFVERAQQLATAHAVDLELARVRQRERQHRRVHEPLVQERIEVGERGRRGNRHRVLLYAVVARVNDVLVNVAHDSTYVIGFGHRSDLDVVERLWASLAVQMTAAAERRMAAGEHRSAGVAGQSWRLSFYDGWVEAVGERLEAARERAVAHVVSAAPPPGDGEPSTALVLRAKADRVQEFYAAESDARGSWRGATSGRTTRSRRAQSAGRADGARADLGQPRVRQRGRLGA